MRPAGYGSQRGRVGFGALAGSTVFAPRFRNPRRTWAGVNLLGTLSRAIGFCQHSAARISNSSAATVRLWSHVPPRPCVALSPAEPITKLWGIGDRNPAASVAALSWLCTAVLADIAPSCVGPARGFTSGTAGSIAGDVVMGREGWSQDGGVAVTEAEDVVADTWLRLARAHEQEPVGDVLGWGTVAVARASLDVLRSARVRREIYVGPWLPEPVITTRDPADRVSLDESVRFALLVTLERLTLAERTAWVLHEVFAVPDRLGPARRVRRPLHAGRRGGGAQPSSGPPARSPSPRPRPRHRPRLTVDPAEHDRIVTTFLAAVRAGDLAALTAALDPDVALTSDGGGTVSAARRPVHGPDHVARLILAITGTTPQQIQLLTVNGSTGLPCPSTASSAPWSHSPPPVEPSNGSTSS